MGVLLVLKNLYRGVRYKLVYLAHILIHLTFIPFSGIQKSDETGTKQQLKHHTIFE
jgi:hypothetical protein